jgi:hypothetical protein
LISTEANKQKQVLKMENNESFFNDGCNSVIANALSEVEEVDILLNDGLDCYFIGEDVSFF